MNETNAMIHVGLLNAGRDLDLDITVSLISCGRHANDFFIWIEGNTEPLIQSVFRILCFISP